MKAAAKQAATEMPAITRNLALNQEDNAMLFPEKMEKGKAIIARADWPNHPIPKRPA